MPTAPRRAARTARARSTNPATAGQILELVRQGAATTRAEVGRATGLSRTAVAARIAALAGSGLLTETDEPGSGVGRPPARLAFDAGSGLVLAAAIGRSRTQVAACDLDGRVLEAGEVGQEVGLGPHALMPRVVAALGEILTRSGRPAGDVRGLGVSIPGTVDRHGRCSVDSPIMSGWHGVDLAPFFGSVTTAPVFVENDTNVIALAERDGHLRTFRDALIVKASTGLGAGIVSGGVLQHGAVGAAGELGHVKFGPAEGIECRCGDSGCLEAVAGGWAIVRDLRESGLEVDHIRDVVDLAVTGDTAARNRIRASGRHVGQVLAAVVTLLDPGAVVIGGDMAPAYDLFVAGLRERLYRDATALATRDLTILAATHGAESGVRGCAALALDQVLSPAAVDAWCG